MYRDGAYPDGPTGRFEPRNLAALADDLGYPLATLRGIADSFAWVQRAAAYDRSLDERRTNAAMSAVDRQRAKQSRVWGMLFGGLEHEVAKLTNMMTGEAPTLKPHQIVAMLKTATDMLRLMAGDPSEHVKVESDTDYSKLTPEEMWQLRELMKKTRK
jgi:hypothetical protein